MKTEAPTKRRGHWYGQKLGGKTIYDYLEDEPSMPKEKEEKNNELGKNTKRICRMCSLSIYVLVNFGPH